MKTTLALAFAGFLLFVLGLGAGTEIGAAKIAVQCEHEEIFAYDGDVFDCERMDDDAMGALDYSIELPVPARIQWKYKA